MKTDKIQGRIPYKKLVMPSARWDETKRIAALAGMRESIGQQKLFITLLRQKTEDEWIVAHRFEDLIGSLEETLRECRRAYEDTLALFN